MIGINNRDLGDFVSLETTAELITDVPAGKAVVSESGYRTPTSSPSSSASAAMRS